MKSMIVGLAALLATAVSAFAAEPAKVMDSSAGKIWTDQKGMTLYTFDKDEAGKSNCYDKCATALAAARSRRRRRGRRRMDRRRPYRRHQDVGL